MRAGVSILGFLTAIACSSSYAGSAVLTATTTEARAEDDMGGQMPISCRGFELVDPRGTHPVALWLENKTGDLIRASFDLEKVTLVKAGKRTPAVGITWEVYKKADDGTLAPGTSVARVSDCDMEVPERGAGMTVYFSGDPAGGDVEFYDLRAKVVSPKQ
jgi:hypothetical protein